MIFMNVHSKLTGSCIFNRYLILICFIFCIQNNSFAQDVPGVVVAKAPIVNRSFVASPAIAILKDGSYVVSHDQYGVAFKGKPKITTVYRSKDKGFTWKKQAEIEGLYWASFLVLNKDLYLMGTSQSIGDIVICKSSDNGLTWTKPLNSKTGLLFEGRYHTAPTTFVAHKGRVWRAYEEDPDPNNPRHFEAFVLSAPENSDLLDAKNWVKSNGLEFDVNLINARAPRWREGNMVPGPDGNMVNLIRLESRQKPKDTYKLKGAVEGMTRYEIAGKIDVSDNGKTASFNPEKGLVSFPGAETKFSVRYDPVSKRYWSLVNKITSNKPGSDFKVSPHHQRNVVMLTSSPDLVNWTEHAKLLRWNEGKTITMEDKYAFQYLDWVFDGNDIIAASRTAWDSVNYHDSNYITFHRFKGFRNMVMGDSPPDLADEHSK
jgi:hypothetical protein